MLIFWLRPSVKIEREIHDYFEFIEQHSILLRFLLFRILFLLTNRTDDRQSIENNDEETQ